MENQKNNKGVIALLIVIIVILSALCILFATGTIILNTNKVNDNDINENVNDNNVENNDEEKESNWVDYLLSRHILDAKITRVRNVGMGDSESLNETVTITMDDLKNILSNLKNNEIRKIPNEGKGGADRDSLVVAYESNYEKYEFKLWNGVILAGKLDSEFINILNNSKSNELEPEYENKEASFYFYSIGNYDETNFDKYFD